MKIEVHHIREESEGGDDTFDNAIALCFDCHGDMRSYDHKHPKGNKYSESELKRHRDNWYEKIKGNIGVADRPTVVATDKNVYEVLVSVLPWDGSMSFVRHNNFAGFSFELARLNNLYEFEHRCEDPAFEFIDPDLEALRAKLSESIDEFTLIIGIETFPTHQLGWNSVPEGWEVEQPERFRDVVSKLHGTAERVVDTYDTLVRTATRKLGILPPQMARQAAVVNTRPASGLPMSSLKSATDSNVQ